MGNMRCDDCGGELSCCGPMTEDGPLLDCLLCQRSEIIATLRAENAAMKAQLEEANHGLAVSEKLRHKVGADCDYYEKKLAASEAKRKVLAEEVRKARAILGPFGTLREGIIQEDGLMYEDARRAVDAANALEGT